MVVSTQKCPQCGEYFGFSGLEYMGAAIWLACRCNALAEDEIACINTNNVKYYYTFSTQTDYTNSMDWIKEYLIKRWGRNVVRALLGGLLAYSLNEVDIKPEDGQVFVQAGTELIVAAIGLLLVEGRSWFKKGQG